MGSVKSTHCRARQREQSRKNDKRIWNAHSMFERQIIIEHFDNLRKRLEHAFLYGTGTEEPVGITQWLSEQNKYYEFCDGWFTYYVNTKTGEKKFKLEEGDVLVTHKQDDFSR